MSMPCYVLPTLGRLQLPQCTRASESHDAPLSKWCTLGHVVQP